MSSKKRELSAIEYYSQIDSAEVCRLLGFKSKRTLWNWVRAGKLPEPRYPAPHKPRWRLGEIVEFVEQQPRFRDMPTGLKGSVAADAFTREESGSCPPSRGRVGTAGTQAAVSTDNPYPRRSLMPNVSLLDERMTKPTGGT